MSKLSKTAINLYLKKLASVGEEDNNEEEDHYPFGGSDDATEAYGEAERKFNEKLRRDFGGWRDRPSPWGKPADLYSYDAARRADNALRGRLIEAILSKYDRPLDDQSLTNLRKIKTAGLIAQHPNGGKAPTLKSNAEAEWDREVADAVRQGDFLSYLEAEKKKLKDKYDAEQKDAKEARDFNIAKDKEARRVKKEMAHARNKDAAWSYGGATVGGGALGALIGGEGNRIKGAIIGALLANAANFARRKYKYGKDVIA